MKVLVIVGRWISNERVVWVIVEVEVEYEKGSDRDFSVDLGMFKDGGDKWKVCYYHSLAVNGTRLKLSAVVCPPISGNLGIF